MLSESFVASTQAPAKAPAPTSQKDVAICIHELRPSSALRSSFKKSSTPPNCLAVTPTHIFAAQTETAIVHVYSREKGNQDATAHFPDRISSITTAGDVVVLGSQGGRLFLWEVCNGIMSIHVFVSRIFEYCIEMKRTVSDDLFVYSRRRVPAAVSQPRIYI